VAFGSSFASFWCARRYGVAASFSVQSAIQALAAPDKTRRAAPTRSPTMIIAGYALLALGYTLLAIAALTGIGH
jgi:hypothetical protein